MKRHQAGGDIGGGEKRRRYPIVDKSLQYKFLSLVFIYGMVIVLFLGIALFVPDMLDVVNEDLSLELRAGAAERMLTLHFRVWPAVLALVCLLAIHSFRIFHRIAGPLFRFRLAYSRVGDGDLGFRLRLRKKDYLHGEETAFNKMMDALQERLVSVSECLDKGLVSMEELEKALPKGGSNSEERRLLSEHKNILEAMAREMRYFHLRDNEDKGEEQGMSAP